MQALLKERNRLNVQKHRCRTDAQKAEIDAQIALLAGKIISVRARQREGLLRHQRDQASQLVQSFEAAQEQLKGSFQNMAELHAEMLRELELDGELESCD